MRLPSRFLTAFLLCVTLAACTPLATRLGFPSATTGPSSAALSSQEQSSAIPIEYGDIEMSSSSSTTAEPVTERLLKEGVLEIGPAQAPLTLQVFTNESCTYCAQFSRDMLGQLEQDYMQSGKLKVQISLVPFQKYPGSAWDEKAVLCAARQSKGLAMHLALFTARAHDRAGMLKAGAATGLDQKSFTSCLDSPDTQAAVQAQELATQALHVTLVPTFILNGKTSVGLPHYADLRGRIDGALQAAH